jgi:hypothetical protein
MAEYGYFVVEGPHDAELVYRLLSPLGFKRVRLETDWDPFLAPLIPRKFPPDGDLQKRTTIPLFLQSDTHAVAVHSAWGDSRIIETIEENAAIIDITAVTGIGVLLDSDKMVPAAQRYQSIRDGLMAREFRLHETPGEVASGRPRLGAFVLPDNNSQGTLEDLLIECAGLVYPGLLDSATAHVDAALSDTTLVARDLEDIKKPAGRNKAIVGSIASILRPGKAIQVSIQDNRWLREHALSISRVKAVQKFLASILGLG